MSVAGVARRSVFGGSAAIAAGALAGCVGGAKQPATSGGPSIDASKKFSGEVEWWTINLQKNYREYIEGMINAYKQAHPDVTIKWVDVPGQDITTKLLAAIAGGTTPDVVNFTSQTLGLFGGSMTPLEGLFSADELKEYVPSLLDQLKQGGRTLAIPWYNGGGSLSFYRKSIVNQAGFDEANPPKTFDEILALAQAVYDKTKVYGLNIIPSYQIMVTEGISMLSDDRRKAAFNTAEAVAIMEKYKKYYDSKAVAPGAIGADARNFEQTLENKQVAMSAIGTTSGLINIQKNAPDVYADLFVTHPVVGKPGKTFMFGQHLFAIPAKAKNPVAGAEWLKFITNAANQLAFCKLVTIYPSSVKALQDPFFTQAKGATPIDVGRQVLVSGFNNLANGSMGTGNDETLISMFDEEMRGYVSGRKSAKDALTAAASKWDTELAKQK